MTSMVMKNLKQKYGRLQQILTLNYEHDSGRAAVETESSEIKTDTAKFFRIQNQTKTDLEIGFVTETGKVLD